MYVVYNVDYEALGEFKTLKEAKVFITGLKRFDRELGNPFDEKYIIEFED